MELQRLDDRIKEIQNEVCQQKKVVSSRFRKMMRSMLLGRRMTVVGFGQHRTNAAFDKAKEAYMESKALLGKAEEKAVNVVDEKYTFIFSKGGCQCNFDGRTFFAIQDMRDTLGLDIRTFILADDVAEFMTKFKESPVLDIEIVTMALKFSTGFPGYHDTTVRFLKEARQARPLCSQSLRNGFRRVECIMEAMRKENPERLLFAMLRDKAVDAGLLSNEEEVKVNDTRCDHSFAMLVGGYMEEGDTVKFGKKVVILMKKRRKSYASGSLIPRWVQYMVMYSLGKGNKEKELTSAALFNAVKDGFVGVDQVIGGLKRILVCSFMYEGPCGEGSQEIATFIGRLVVDLLVTTTMRDEEATDFMMKLADDLPTDSNATETLRLAKLLILYADKGVVRRCWIGGTVDDMDSPEMKEIEMMIEQVLLKENEDEKKNKEKVEEAMTRVKQLLTPYWNSHIVSEILKNVVAIYIDNTNLRKRLLDFLNLCRREGVITAAMMKAGFNKTKKDILAQFERYSMCLKEAEKLGWFTESERKRDASSKVMGSIDGRRSKRSRK